MDRRIYTARLSKKTLLSERAQCFHLQFAVEEVNNFEFLAGQFVSLLSTDSRGKHQTRAYSIASAPQGNHFELCLNRVEGGYFSNLLADLSIGDTIQFHGPHGLFTLQPPLTHTVLIATGTGIAPMRGFVEQLFPSSQQDRSEDRKIWLVYGTRHETEIYYRNFFEKTAAEHSNFNYMPTLSRPHEGWEGLRGYVQEHVRSLLKEYAGHNHAAVESGSPMLRAYICGLNEMVSANREQLKQLGWDKKQIRFERYD